jgi:hypothetical protein
MPTPAILLYAAKISKPRADENQNRQKAFETTENTALF